MCEIISVAPYKFASDACCQQDFKAMFEKLIYVFLGMFISLVREVTRNLIS